MLWGGLCLFSSSSTAAWFAAETPLTASVIAEEASVSADVHSVFLPQAFVYSHVFALSSDFQQWFHILVVSPI